MPSRDPSRPLYCWDTSVFISWLADGKDITKNEWIELQLVEAEITSDKAGLITSVISLAEVLGDHSRADKLDRFHRFLEQLSCDAIEVNDVVAREAGRLRQHFRVTGQVKRMPLSDAIYLATAGLYNATHLHTFDQKLLLKINGRVPEHSFGICKPKSTVKEEKKRTTRADKNQIDLLDEEADAQEDEEEQ